MTLLLVLIVALMVAQTWLSLRHDPRARHGAVFTLHTVAGLLLLVFACVHGPAKVMAHGFGLPAALGLTLAVCVVAAVATGVALHAREVHGKPAGALFAAHGVFAALALVAAIAHVTAGALIG